MRSAAAMDTPVRRVLRRQSSRAARAIHKIPLSTGREIHGITASKKGHPNVWRIQSRIESSQ